MRRVVVTGLGAVTPIGNNMATFWDSVKRGKVGFAPISRFDASGYKCRLAAEVKDFVPEERIEKKALRRMELFCQYGAAAAGEAIEDAGLDLAAEDAWRVGCAVGSGIGSLQVMERECERFLQKGAARVSPLFMPTMLANMAAGNISILYGLKGKCMNVMTACATGTSCIGEAFRSIRYGDADVMLAGGSEGAVTPLGIAGFAALTVLSDSEDPHRCSIPFDRERSGFVMGEGAGVVVLEELEHARHRGARIYAEVLGYGCSADAYHITSPAEDGSGAARAMRNALEDGKVRPEEVTYVNAHGTGTRCNDLFETRAIKLAFGEQAKKLKINSTKSLIGHLLGAAGAVEFIVCVKELQEGFLHRTAGLRESEEELDLDYCRESFSGEIPYALSNSLGFGGHNASLLIGRFSEK